MMFAGGTGGQRCWFREWFGRFVKREVDWILENSANRMTFSLGRQEGPFANCFHRGTGQLRVGAANRSGFYNAAVFVDDKFDHHFTAQVPEAKLLRELGSEPGQRRWLDHWRQLLVHDGYFLPAAEEIGHRLGYLATLWVIFEIEHIASQGRQTLERRRAARNQSQSEDERNKTSFHPGRIMEPGQPSSMTFACRTASGSCDGRSAGGGVPARQG